MIQLRDFLSLFVIFSVILLTSGQQQYCRIARDHTMCLFGNQKPICNARSSGLTENQKWEILNLHNTLRQKVASGNEKRGNPGPQPRAKYMPNMEWDNELANIAQRWANQCTFKHDKCRNTQEFKVGQNIATMWTTSTSTPANIMTDLVTMWYDEVADFDSRQVEKFTGKNFKKIGHYTQMLWATSVKLGCGYVNYQNGYKNTMLLVCNYGPAGNVVDDKIYEIRRW